jgi:hypothetical protein
LQALFAPQGNACLKPAPAALGQTEESPLLSRRTEIEAAIAAHNSADREPLLPPAAALLLAVMFRRGSVCQRSLDDLAAEGFDRRSLPKLLRGLVEAGFLSKGRPSVRAPNTYTLHLPPVPR